MNWVNENFYSIVLTLAVLALCLMLYLRKRKRSGIYKLEKDSTGFHRYHKDTQYQRKLAFEKSKGEKEKKVVGVITFQGDIRAKHHRSFAQLVDEVIINKDELAEVVVVVTSSGGLVPPYGHVYSEMERIRNIGLPLTVCIDVVGASGGYMMSLPATKIIAAPFAVVGSVGVMAFVPNFRKLLVDWNIAPRTFTAGKLKRTVTLTDDATPEELARFQSQLEAIHELFLNVVRKYRPSAKLEEVVTGDHWTATESMEKGLGLVDEIRTSNDYLLERNRTADLLIMGQKKSFFEETFKF